MCRNSGIKFYYLENGTDEHVMNSKNKNVSNLCTFINEFKKHYKEELSM
jgi:hypothetical protein